MAYQYPHGGASPIIPHAVSPVPRAVTPTIPIPGAQAGPIQPGSITYTTTVGPDGQLIYHPFKCVRMRPFISSCGSLIGRSRGHL